MPRLPHRSRIPGITVDDDGNVSGVSGAYTVQITRVAGTEQYTIRLGGAMSSVYLGCRSNTDQLNSAVDGSSSYARWIISWQDGHIVIQNARFQARSLQYCADKQYFRCVRNTQTPLTLYHGEDSGLWYTTALHAAHEHRYAESGRQPATCTAPGWVEYACTVCGSTYRDTLDPLGHAFHDKASAVCAQAATCTEPAQYFVQCDRCDAVSDALTVTVGEALGHAYENGVCIRCGALMPVAPFEDVPDDAYYTDAVYWGRSLWNHERRRRQPLCSERDVHACPDCDLPLERSGQSGTGIRLRSVYGRVGGCLLLQGAVLGDGK